MNEKSGVHPEGRQTSGVRGIGARFAALAAMLAAGIALAAFPPPADASKTQISVFEDPRTIMGQGPEWRNWTLDQLRMFGADSIRITAAWRSIAPNPKKNKMPRNLNDTDPSSYGSGAWATIDGVVRAASARGIQVFITIGGPCPRWGAKKNPGSRAQACYGPNVNRFSRFAQAVATRYSGSYKAEDGSGTLPAVNWLGIWNEPNLGKFLMPQYTGPVLAGVKTYRSIVTKTARRLRKANPRAQIQIGETSPMGTGAKRAQAKVAPGFWLPGLYCLDPNTLRPAKGYWARVFGCRGKYRKLPIDRVGHHPYTSYPTQLPKRKDQIPMGRLGLLVRIIGAADRYGRIPRGTGIYLTEFGVQSNPPDRMSGVSLSNQASYVNGAEHMAYKVGRVKSMAQYLMCDDWNVRGGFQSGLYYASCEKKKPLYNAYWSPIDVEYRGSSRNEVGVWGAIRSFDQLPQGKRSTTIQYRSGRKWRNLKTVGVAAMGYFNTTAKKSGIRGKRIRHCWKDASNKRHCSRIARAHSPWRVRG